VTAYQDGVWLGRAIVPVDAIASGEAPPEWNYGPECFWSRPGRGPSQAARKGGIS